MVEILLMVPMHPKPREIYLVPFPYSDLSSSKLRPAIVLSRETFNEETGLCIVCAITSNPSLPYSLEIADSDLESGQFLGHSSSVLYGKLFTVESSILAKRILKMKQQKFSEISEKLKGLI